MGFQSAINTTIGTVAAVKHMQTQEQLQAIGAAEGLHEQGTALAKESGKLEAAETKTYAAHGEASAAAKIAKDALSAGEKEAHPRQNGKFVNKQQYVDNLRNDYDRAREAQKRASDETYAITMQRFDLEQRQNLFKQKRDVLNNVFTKDKKKPFIDTNKQDGYLQHVETSTAREASGKENK